MTPIRLADLREAKVRRPDNPPASGEQLMLNLTDRAHSVVEWGMRHALAQHDESVAWELDSALAQLEQACALMRRELTAQRFKEAA